MRQTEFLKVAEQHIFGLKGHTFNVIALEKPASQKHSTEMVKIISKLSPIVGNLIELQLVEYLNEFEFDLEGSWLRQDPDFPDAVYQCNLIPNPGFEIKAWYPLATEITARFKDSQSNFSHNQINVIMPAWLPEFMYYGKPKLIDIVILNGLSVAKSRDAHYFDPPDYLVLEPEDTSARTRNLQQTNTSGYKIQYQRNTEKYKKAEDRAKELGLFKNGYLPSREYQSAVKTLFSEFNYRLDTNYAKMDRIVHPELESFKSEIMEKVIYQTKISDWQKTFNRGTDAQIDSLLKKVKEVC